MSETSHAIQAPSIIYLYPEDIKKINYLLLKFIVSRERDLVVEITENAGSLFFTLMKKAPADGQPPDIIIDKKLIR